MNNAINDESCHAKSAGKACAVLRLQILHIQESTEHSAYDKSHHEPKGGQRRLRCERLEPKM